MNSSISFEKNEDYLQFTYSGKYDFDELMSYLKMIENKCTEENIHKALLDLLQMEGAMTNDMERFYLGEELSTLFGYKIKFAYVSQVQYTTRFGETVAINRGANSRVFNDLESARKWLLNLE